MLREENDAANESFRVLADLIPQLVFICDRDGKPVYVNGPFLTFTGLTAAVALQRGIFDRLHDADIPSVYEAWQHSLATAQPFEHELRMKSGDGTYRWFICRARAMCGAEGGALRWYGTLTDIEEQKRTEETLVQIADAGNTLSRARGAEATLEVLADTAVQAFADWCSIYTYDTDGKLQVAAVAHRDPSRLSMAHALIRRYPMHEADAAWQVALTGEPLVFTYIDDDMLRASAIDEQHYRMMSELGLRSAMIVPLRARGQRLGALSLVSAESNRSYTQRDLRLAQALAQRAALAYDAWQLIDELTRSQHDLRQLIELIPQMVWVNHPITGSIEFANRRWLEYFDIDEEQNRRWAMHQYVHPDDVGPALERWRESLRTGQSYETEYRLRKHDGTYHWFLARGLPIRDARGQITRWLGSATDIDAQKLERERVKHVADTLQQAFIPRMLPQRPHVHFDAAYIPAENAAAIGGDWYDAFEVDDGTIVFSIGDVAGHGLEAAVAMGNIRQAILGASVDSTDPAEVLAKVNRLMLLQQSHIATAIVGFIKDGEVVYCSAGHPPPVLARAGNARFLPHGGMPLGVDRQGHVAMHRVAIEPGTLLVLYTDGLTEARREIDEDEEKLLEVCARASRNGMKAADIRAAVLGLGTSPDDTAIMMLRF
jgi:PAS domain S-box-containing protein